MPKKKTRAEKVLETKELAMNIDATVEIGTVDMSNTQTMRVSIIRARGGRYTAITPFYRESVEDQWKPRASVWIPADYTGEIAELVARAHKKMHEEEDE